MALSLSTSLQTALDADGGNLAVLFTFDFGTVYGLWTGPGTAVYNAITYQAGGSLIELPTIEENADGSVEDIVLALNAAPDKGLTTDVLASLFAENWHMQPVTIQVAVCNPDTGAIIAAVTKFRGRIEQATYVESGDADRIEALCRSWSLDLSLAGNLYRHGQTQRLLDPDDPSFDEIGLLTGAAVKDAYWGQK